MTNSTIIRKRKEICREIEVDSLIALCEIENYDVFCKELESLISSNKNKNLIWKLYEIMLGRHKFGNKKYKDFVKKYENVIEIMKKNHCLSNMIVDKYNSDGSVNKNSTEDYFYRFILDHKEDLEAIKSVVLKIKSLGFDKIIYGENLDFTNVTYELSNLYNCRFEFLENIDVIPTYSIYPIKYVSKGSCYRMILKTVGYGSQKSLSKYNRVIELNSLIFDPKRLPDDITNAIDFIKSLVDKNKKDCQVIRDTVNLSVCVDDLVKQYDHTKKTIDSIENVENKKELEEALHNILREITVLELLASSFERENVSDSSKVDFDKIKLEKELYLKRREAAKYDYD